MGLIQGVSLRLLESIQGGMSQFYTPQSSHETMLVEVPAGTVDELFVHRFQTDQLLIVRGEMVLVILQNRSYRYVALSEYKPQVVTIPPGVLHGAVNLTCTPCVLVNAVLRHGEVHERDYRPMKPPFPYDITKIKAEIEKSRALIASEVESPTQSVFT